MVHKGRNATLWLSDPRHKVHPCNLQGREARNGGLRPTAVVSSVSDPVTTVAGPFRRTSRPGMQVPSAREQGVALSAGHRTAGHEHGLLLVAV